MDKRSQIVIVVMVMCFIVLTIDARPNRTRKLQKLNQALKKKIRIPVDVDRIKFQKAVEIMELLSKRGMSLVDARNRFPFLDKVIKVLDERNKNDPTISGKQFPDYTKTSRVMRKRDFCTCENKDADQLCGDRTADVRRPHS